MASNLRESRFAHSAIDEVAVEDGPLPNPCGTQPTRGTSEHVDGMGDSEKPIPTGYVSTPQTPEVLSRATSSSDIASHETDDLDPLPPLDRLTVFDFLENLALPQRIEKLQNSISTQAEKVRRQQQKIKTSSKQARERVVDEWRRRVPPPDEQLSKYRQRMRTAVDRLGSQWNNTKTVTQREKASFIAGVLNIFISGYLIGAYPDRFHYWYTVQFCYFYPLRFWLYRKKGYHYFLADLCYFVNFLLLLSIWVFPRSKRLFISAFCLGFGNNAVAIAMWRNSLVFHSFDKVTSLFIHVMPCATMHCLVHLVPREIQATRFPAIYHIKTSLPGTRDHYGLVSMAIWSTVPYALWQVTYHLMITVGRRDQIAAGRPTSFTWLLKSYSKTWLGKIVLSLPESLQEPAFMLIQYSYALMTMLPAPIWFWYRWPSAIFLMCVFTWSVYNGANYYLDVFGNRFQKELEAIKKDVVKWQTSPDIAAKTPNVEGTPDAAGQETRFSLGNPAVESTSALSTTNSGRSSGVESAVNIDTSVRRVAS